MTTSLQRQLLALAAPSSAQLVVERKVVSILFSHKDASGYNREIFYSLGIQGLQELISVDPDLFEKYLKSMLFNAKAIEFERIVESREENRLLDEEINNFLVTLSPYFMLPSSLKCLEWLVNRFHIHQFNVTGILECIIPYYDTKNFTLVLRVLQIERFQTAENNQWHWIISNIKTGLPLSKALVYSNSNPYFINWLFSLFYKFVGIHMQQPNNLKSFIGFMTSTIVGILNSIMYDIPRKEDKNKRIMFRCSGVVHCLWMQAEAVLSEVSSSALPLTGEITSMIYVVCALLGLIGNQKPELMKGNENLIVKSMHHIFKSHPPEKTTQVYLLLNLLVPFTTRVFKFESTTLARILVDITSVGASWDLYNISSKILIDNVTYPKSGLTYSKIWTTLSYFEMKPPQRAEMLKNIYQKLQLSKNHLSRKWAKGFLSRFERQYPTEFGIICDSDPQFASDLVHFKSGQNLAVLAHHADAAIRGSAVRKLLKRVAGKVQSKLQKRPPDFVALTKLKGSIVTPKIKGMKPDKGAIAKAILPRFQDEDVSILLTVLKSDIHILVALFTRLTLAKSLISVIRKRLTLKTTKLALRHLCSLALIKENSKFTSKILTILIPFLFPRKDGGPMKLAIAILKSDFAKRNKFLKQYASLLQNNVTKDELCNFSYNVLVSFKGAWERNEEQLDLLQQFIFILSFSRSDDVDQILSIAESTDCIITRNYPVTQINFPHCLELSEKKGRMSLDFIFTSIIDLDAIENFQQQSRVIKFAWKLGEKIPKLHLCVQFISDFIKKTFRGAESQVNFWCSMIRQNRDDEYFLLRSLQFLSRSLEQNPKLLKKYLINAKLGESGTSDKSEPHVESKYTEEHLFELLLTQPLYNDSHRVRAWTVNCLKIIHGSTYLGDVFRNFINEIIVRHNEIIADKEQMPRIISTALAKREYEVVRDRFVNMIIDPRTQESLSIGIVRICHLMSSQVFSRFLPKTMDLLSKNPESDILIALLECYDPTLDKSLKIAEEALKHKHTCKKVLSKLTKETIRERDIKFRRILFQLIIETVLKCEIPEITVVIQRCVRKWTVEASIIATELDKCLSLQKDDNAAPPILVRHSRMNKNPSAQSRRGSKVNARFTEHESWSKRAEAVLELIQTRNQLLQMTKLIRPLFKILKICIGLEEQGSVEYLKQLILTTLTMCCSEDSKSQESNDDWMDFNVETVVDCLRCSRNPQTHHHALILLNYAAQLYPEQVLHGVMSLFTFMGNSILRQDDNYSTQLIQQTVTTIIPTFVNTNVVRKYSITRVSAGIYFAFASAVQDIPVHRRVPVFTSLVETLNPRESMWQLCVTIIDKALTRDKKRSNLTADIELALDIVAKFEPAVALKTMEKIYSYLSELPVYERPMDDEAFKLKRLGQSANSKAVVDLTRKLSLRDVEILIYYTLELVLKVCTTFLNLEDVKLCYDALLEKCFTFSRLVANIHDDKIFRLIAQRNLDIIEKVNSALEPTDLVETVLFILNKDDLSVKKKILDVVNNRIAHKLEWFGDSSVLLALMKPLVEFCNSEKESDEAVTIVQTSFISLKLISRHLASTYPEDFVAVFNLSFENTTHSNKLLCASAFACLGELFCLKSLILPNLNSVCSAILKAIKASSKLNSLSKQNDIAETGKAGKQPDIPKHEPEVSASVANLLCISALSCMTKLCDNLGTFLGAKFLQKSLIAVLGIDGFFGQGDKATNRKRTFDQRLKLLLKSISTKIPLRNSLPSIQKVFRNVTSPDDFTVSTSTVLLFDILKDSLANTSKVDFPTLLPLISDAFLVDFMTYREKISNKESEFRSQEHEIAEVEDAMLDCLINGIVLKISESAFRSFYHRIFDWTGESTERLLTFYRFSGNVAEKLKSLFVTFAGHILNNSAVNLNVDVRLTRSILKYQYHIFSNDREGFITMDRFNALVKPLVDMIESEFVVTGDIDITQVCETLVQLAVATNDLNRWQYLIELLSFKSQHINPQVRLFVLSVLDAVSKELGKDFLPLLPPAVPFLAELIVDGDEKVEIATKRLLIKLEAIVGEPLNTYFL